MEAEERMSVSEVSLLLGASSKRMLKLILRTVTAPVEVVKKPGVSLQVDAVTNFKRT
ncbi:hypothetical protein PIB30_036434 [Stylosanthes scabra]|uniref:Uncharacterized protein n=1 Tax=Stylosanthes scabra TaxID=79078 RepID=A0ABU6TE48_9FABA|nr:hypothetical protein [Stylosanthes scabra]